MRVRGAVQAQARQLIGARANTACSEQTDADPIAATGAHSRPARRRTGRIPIADYAFLQPPITLPAHSGNYWFFALFLICTLSIARGNDRQYVVIARAPTEMMPN